LATPRAVFEALVLPRCLLNGRNVLPSLVIARAISMMQRIEDAKPRLPRGSQDLQHVRNAVIRFCNSADATPELASLGNEVVVRIDHQKRGDLLFISPLCHAPSRTFSRPAAAKRPAAIASSAGSSGATRTSPRSTRWSRSGPPCSSAI